MKGKDKGKGLAGIIDHTFLKAAGDRDAVKRLCDEAKKAGFAAVCVNPCEVAECARRLRGTGVRVCTVVGFPLGQSTLRTKCFEALDALQAGADELDLVVNQRLLKYAPAACGAELLQWVRTCRTVRSDATLKLILECCNLSRAEIVRGCKMAKKAGFDFVKTSTGFAAGGATAADVALMRASVSDKVRVKASGGIRTLDMVLACHQAGAARCGVSATAKIMAEAKERFANGTLTDQPLHPAEEKAGGAY